MSCFKVVVKQEPVFFKNFLIKFGGNILQNLFCCYSTLVGCSCLKYSICQNKINKGKFLIIYSLHKCKLEKKKLVVKNFNINMVDYECKTQYDDIISTEEIFQTKNINCVPPSKCDVQSIFVNHIILQLFLKNCVRINKKGLVVFKENDFVGCDYLKCAFTNHKEKTAHHQQYISDDDYDDYDECCLKYVRKWNLSTEFFF